MKRIDLTGKKFGRLTVVRCGKLTKAGLYWHCHCACGNDVEVYGGSLRYGKTTSCGCNMAPTTHGMYGTAVHAVWNAMRQRCSNPKNRMYSHYGGRGITVDPAWAKFENFVTDMGIPPKGMVLDRIDNDGNYTLKNCRWVTAAKSARNTSRNVMLTHRGMTLCLSDWATLTGISRDTLNHRRLSGWKVEDVLDTPVDKARKRSKL